MYNTVMKSFVQLAILMISIAANTVSACKPLSEVFKALPKGQDNWLDYNGITCFSLTLDLQSIPPGRNESDLRSYYGMLIGAAAAQGLPPTQGLGVLHNEYKKYQLTAVPLLSLGAVQNKALATMNAYNAMVSKPQIKSLSNVTLTYNDPERYKLTFHPKGANPLFFYQNGKTQTHHPNAPNFPTLPKTYSYSTNVTSGTWSLDYYDSKHGLTAGTEKPLSTVQLGLAVNGRPLTNTLQPVNNISHGSERRIHYVVNGDGLAGMAGEKTMGFAIVADPLDPPSCADLKSVYAASSCCDKQSVGCGILKSQHRANSCCGTPTPSGP